MDARRKVLNGADFAWCVSSAVHTRIDHHITIFGDPSTLFPSFLCALLFFVSYSK